MEDRFKARREKGRKKERKRYRRGKSLCFEMKKVKKLKSIAVQSWEKFAYVQFMVKKCEKKKLMSIEKDIIAKMR